MSGTRFFLIGFAASAAAAWADICFSAGRLSARSTDSVSPSSADEVDEAPVDSEESGE